MSNKVHFPTDTLARLRMLEELSFRRGPRNLDSGDTAECKNGGQSDTVGEVSS